MKVETITHILDEVPGVRKEGGAWLLAEDTEVSIYVSIAAEVLTVPRVARVVPERELMTVTTFKNERFYFAPESVSGIRIGSTEHRSGRSAGFGK